MDWDETRSSTARGRPAKRLAVVQAARTVFGRDGYERAGIATIAAEAEVSTRTIYNHFAGKDALFAEVIATSSAQVADTLTDLISRFLRDVEGADDVEQALVDLGTSWSECEATFAEHFRVVRRIRLDAHRHPPDLLDAWREAGPRRVERALAEQLTRLAGRGQLVDNDATRAAGQYMSLTVGMVSAHVDEGSGVLDRDEVASIVRAGVRLFLYGMLPR